MQQKNSVETEGEFRTDFSPVMEFLRSGLAEDKDSAPLIREFEHIVLSSSSQKEAQRRLGVRVFSRSLTRYLSSHLEGGKELIHSGFLRAELIPAWDTKEKAPRLVASVSYPRNVNAIPAPDSKKVIERVSQWVALNNFSLVFGLLVVNGEECRISPV